MEKKPGPEYSPSVCKGKLGERWDAFLESLAQHVFVQWILGVWEWVRTTGRMLWLCGYAVVAVLVVLFLFVFNDQGLDLLRISAEDLVSLWNLMFFLGTAALSLTVWYTSRLLLGREFKAYPLDLDSTSRRRLLLPRLFGVSVPLSIAAGLFRIDSDIHGTEIWMLFGLYLLLAILVLVFFRFRRDWFGIDSERMVKKRVHALEGCDLALVLGAGILSFALLISFMIWPVGLPQWLGAPAIVMLAFVGIVLFGSMVLNYAFLAFDQPSATLLAMFLAVVFGIWVDNHEVRLTDDAPALARVPPAEHYERWRQAHPSFEPISGREPAILVAAAGGGIRAAYWTATSLATMEAISGFNDNLFAISGVSGGSLGAATYTALRQALGADGHEALKEEVRRVLGEDFLSPVMAGLLFPDLAQRFFPISVAAADRQRFLEMSWEDAVGRAMDADPNPFSSAFTALYAGDDGPGLPSLLLNATLVDSGRRAVVSNIEVGGFTDTLDLIADDLSTRNIRLSAAAGASARFTYVSPAGTLVRENETHENGQEKYVLKVVDGGYFENSGAATIMDLLVALRQRDADNLYPILILIRNDPKAPSVCQRGDAGTENDLSRDASSGLYDNLLKEVSAPLRALLNARTARGRLAEVDAARQVEDRGGAVIEISLAAMFRAAIKAAGADETKLARLRERAVEPPLGWSLSRDVRDEMDATLNEGKGGLDKEFAMLEALLRGDTGSYEPCDAR